MNRRFENYITGPQVAIPVGEATEPGYLGVKLIHPRPDSDLST
jgi:hypothetical protein